MQGLGKGGGGGHGGGGFHHGGGGGGFRPGGGFRRRGPRTIFTGGFGPGWGYPYWDDSYPLQVVVPDSCEENVRAGCYKRWGHDQARMASCVADGYKGCGLQGFGAIADCSQRQVLGFAAVAAAVAAGTYYMTDKPVVSGGVGALAGILLLSLGCKKSA